MIEFKQVMFEFQIQTSIKYIIIQIVDNSLNNWINLEYKIIEHLLKAH